MAAHASGGLRLFRRIFFSHREKADELLLTSVNT